MDYVNIWEVLGRQWVEEDVVKRYSGVPLSEGTRENRLCEVMAFAHCLGAAVECESLSEDVLRKYRRWVEQRPVAEATRQNHLRVVYRFLLWCDDHGYGPPRKVAEILRRCADQMPARLEAMNTSVLGRRHICGRQRKTGGRKIADFRQRLGMDVPSFAALLHVAPGTVYYYERRLKGMRLRVKTERRLRTLFDMGDEELLRERARVMGELAPLSAEAPPSHYHLVNTQNAGVYQLVLQAGETTADDRPEDVLCSV